MSTENKQRDKLDYIQFDHDFLSKHKTQALHFKFGNDGLLAIMGAIFLMGNATDGEIEIDAFIANARIYGCDADKCKEILDYCLHPDRKLFLSGSKSGWITNSRVTEDQERVYLKREKWRASQKKRRCHDGVSSDVMQDTHETSHETLNTEHMNTEDLNSEDLDPNPKEGGQGETKSTQSSIVQNKPPKIQFGEHVYLTQTEIDNVQNKHGTAFFERCCEKLNAWIEQDPTPKRRKNGKNAGATFRAWVLNAVAEEEVRASRTSTRAPPYQQKMSNAEKTMAVYRKIEAEELAKMRMKDEEN